MKTEVFNYSRTYKDRTLDRKITSVSKFKAAMDFIKKQEKDNKCGAHYQILEETREYVDSDTIIGGKYHPELRR